MTEEHTLGDLGERRIVREILPQYCEEAGDDCAAVRADKDLIAITTDPVPEPAAKVIGGDSDLYWMGWLLVTINLSDIAAAGARPVAFVAAVDAPATLKVTEFERLLSGIRDSCQTHGTKYVGGNLRESLKLSATGTAIGICETGQPLSRSGAAVGDTIVSVGHGGRFWRDAMAIRAGRLVAEKDASPLFKPIAQVAAMRRLHGQGFITAAMDNSDGLVASLEQFAITSECTAELDIEALRLGETGSQQLSDDNARYWLGWGDWNVIGTVPWIRLAEAVRFAEKNGDVLIPIGRIVDTVPRVQLRGKRETILAPRIESERFAKDSWFSTGIESYIEMLMGVALPN